MRPVHEMLIRAAGRGAFHMPGHKGRAPFGPEDLYALDTTELPSTDDLYAAESGLLSASRLYAEAAGAGETLFLHNGTTQGIHVMLQLYAREGDTVILPRNAHLSAANACIMGGLRTVWMSPSQTPDGYVYLTEETILRTLDAHPEAKALLLTRPDYYGGALSSDALRRVIARAGALGIRVVVDEAHGAHFPFMPEMDSAGALGADAWVQSVHKTLPGLTGCAVLHLRDPADHDRAMTLLRRGQTSSPSFLMMMAIDDARAFMVSQGRQRLRRTMEGVEALRRSLPAGLTDAHAAWRATGQVFDPTRLVLSDGSDGHDLLKRLAGLGIDCEMADDRRVVLIITCMDGEEQLFALRKALEALPPGQIKPLCVRPLQALPPKVMELRPAAMAMTETVPLSACAGRISAVPAGLYPPGVPLVMPGELIPEEIARLLLSAPERERFGCEGGNILCVC